MTDDIRESDVEQYVHPRDAHLIASVPEMANRIATLERERDEARAAAQTWENEAERRSRRYEKDVAEARAQRDAAEAARAVAMIEVGKMTDQRDALAAALREYTRLRDTQYPGPAPHEWAKCEAQIDAALAKLRGEG